MARHPRTTFLLPGRLRPTSRRAWKVYALGWLLPACGCASLGVGDGFDSAQIRFVDVAPGPSSMDFYVNGAGAAYALGYESFTSYLPVGPGPVNLAVHRAGNTQALLTAGGTLTGRHQYTAILSHLPGGLREQLFEDRETPAPAGQIALRVLNAAGGAAALGVYVTPNGGTGAPEAVFTVPAGVASPYLDRTAGIGYTITATVADGDLNLPVASVNVSGGSGAVRTVIFAGTAVAGAHGSAGTVGSVVGFSLVDGETP